MPSNGSIIRDSNFELLRIVLIIMVICLHYLGHGGALGNLKPFDPNFFPAYLIECLSIVAVNGFILITGYYQVKFRWKKAFDIWMQVFFYSVVISVMFWIAKIEPVTIKELVQTFFPVIMGRWWFITLYVMLYLLAPFINLALNNMDKKAHERLLIILSIFIVILPSLNYTFFYDNGYSIQNFIFLYCVGAYIRKYDIPRLNYIIIYFVSSLLLLAAVIVFKIFDIGLGRLFSYNFIFVEIAAISLFIYFKNIKIRSQNINQIATGTLGIYLISDHPYIRNILYTKVLHLSDYYFSHLFFPYMIISLITVFTCCLIIELVRQRIFAMIQNKIWTHSTQIVNQ
jgi:surface polysaccharide O-acyltransferase-like enzyme